MISFCIKSNETASTIPVDIDTIIFPVLKIGCPCRAESIYYSLLKTHDITEKNIMLIIIRQIWEMIKIPVMDLSQPTAIKSTVLSNPRIKKKRKTSSSK